MYVHMFAINFLTSNKSLWMPRSRLVTKTKRTTKKIENKNKHARIFHFAFECTQQIGVTRKQYVIDWCVGSFFFKRTGIHFLFASIKMHGQSFFISFHFCQHSPVPLQLSLQFSSAIPQKSKWLRRNKSFSHLSLSKISTLVFISVSDSFSPFA